jgi:hypothetical protein
LGTITAEVYKDLALAWELNAFGDDSQVKRVR